MWRLEPAYNASVTLKFTLYGAAHATFRDWPASWTVALHTTPTRSQRPHCDGQVLQTVSEVRRGCAVLSEWIPEKFLRLNSTTRQDVRRRARPSACACYSLVARRASASITHTSVTHAASHARARATSSIVLCRPERARARVSRCRGAAALLLGPHPHRPHVHHRRDLCGLHSCATPLRDGARPPWGAERTLRTKGRRDRQRYADHQWGWARAFEWTQPRTAHSWDDQVCIPPRRKGLPRDGLGCRRCDPEMRSDPHAVQGGCALPCIRSMPSSIEQSAQIESTLEPCGVDAGRSARGSARCSRLGLVSRPGTNFASYQLGAAVSSVREPRGREPRGVPERAECALRRSSLLLCTASSFVLAPLVCCSDAPRATRSPQKAQRHNGRD